MSSGASWFNCPLCFGQYDSLDEFLGAYTPPEDLSVDRLRDVGEPRLSYMGCLADSNSMLSFGAEILEGVFSASWYKNRSQAWTDMVAKSYLKPFGIGQTSESTATAGGTRGNVHARIGVAAKGVRYGVHSCNKAELPFPIITQASF